MDEKREDNVEMQQIGAYATKHKPHQPGVPLMEERQEDDVTRIEGSDPPRRA